MPGYQYGATTVQHPQPHTTVTELRAELAQATTRVAALEARVHRLRGARAEAHAATRRAEDAERSLEHVRRVALEATEQAKVWRARAETAEQLLTPDPQGAHPGNKRLAQAADEIADWNRRQAPGRTRHRPALHKTAHIGKKDTP